LKSVHFYVEFTIDHFPDQFEALISGDAALPGLWNLVDQFNEYKNGSSTTLIVLGMHKGENDVRLAI
jgi:hypothetical protein